MRCPFVDDPTADICYWLNRFNECNNTSDRKPCEPEDNDGWHEPPDEHDEWRDAVMCGDM